MMPWPTAVATYLVYLLIQAILMTWFFGILFQQHGMRKFKIGIGAMLILTTMIALPFGTTSVYLNQASPTPASVAEQPPDAALETYEPMRSELAMISVFYTIVLYFVLLPLLIVLEAAIAWFVAFRKRRTLGSTSL